MGNWYWIPFIQEPIDSLQFGAIASPKIEWRWLDNGFYIPDFRKHVHFVLVIKPVGFTNSLPTFSPKSNVVDGYGILRDLNEHTFPIGSFYWKQMFRLVNCVAVLSKCPEFARISFKFPFPYVRERPSPILL